MDEKDQKQEGFRKWCIVLFDLFLFKHKVQLEV